MQYGAEVLPGRWGALQNWQTLELCFEAPSYGLAEGTQLSKFWQILKLYFAMDRDTPMGCIRDGSQHADGGALRCRMNMIQLAAS
jgi:hypothetical protein